MKTTIWIISLFVSLSSWSQTKSEIKKIEKILGKDFSKAEAENYYRKTYSKNVQADTSLVIKYDTTGIHKNGEYLMFRSPLTYDKRKESFKFIKQTPVTVNEYNEFIDWVRDSIAREKLFYGLSDDVMAHSFLIEHKDNCSDACLKSREQAREKYSFNWDIEVDYENRDYIPILADMYLPQPERFFQKHEFDTRKLMYSYQEAFSEYPEAFISEQRNSNPKIRDWGYADIISIDDEFPRTSINQVNIYPDYYSIASSENLIYTENCVLGEVYPAQFKNSSLYGLLGTQASAYCAWLGHNINLQLVKKGTNLIAKVTLPVEGDLSVKEKIELIIPKTDYTNTWRITLNEFKEFTQYVKDSLIQEKLYSSSNSDEEANQLIEYQPSYFDDGSLEFVDFDPSDRFMNREAFFLKKNIDLIQFLNGKYIDTITLDFKTEKTVNSIGLYEYYEKEVSNNSLLYRCYWKDIEAIAFVGHYFFSNQSGNYELDYDDLSNTYEPLSGYKNRYGWEEYPSTKGKSFRLGGFFNDLGSNLTIRSHENRQQFIISVLPTINDKIKTKDDISYEQALAFYTWKYPRWKMNTSMDNWQQFVFPTEEQFKKVQNGEKVVIPEHSIEYPTPVFRYVVHLYEK